MPGGADALVKLLDSEATPKACNGASHALHMLVRSADLCKGVAEAGAVRVLCRMAAERGQMLDGAMPAAAALCNLAETSTNIRAQIRECNGCDALASPTGIVQIYSPPCSGRVSARLAWGASTTFPKIDSRAKV